MGVQEVRRDGGGTEAAGEYTFFYRQGNENHDLGTGFFIHKRRIMSLVKRTEFVSDRFSYIIILKGRWCDNNILNIHALTEDKIDDMKNSSELEHVFDNYRMKILLGEFIAKSR
jgi:hypothetical protein